MTKCPSMIECSKSKWNFSQVWQNAQGNKIPKRHYAQDDNMPNKSFCPMWQIIIKETSPMHKLTKCIKIWPEISRFWPIFNFRHITIFSLIKKPIILLKFCWKIQMADFRPEKARQASEQIFTLGIKSLGKMSSLGNMLPWALCLWVF